MSGAGGDPGEGDDQTLHLPLTFSFSLPGNKSKEAKWAGKQARKLLPPIKLELLDCVKI